MNTHAARFASVLALIEVGLGSFLHALHFPFRGQLLSMNQGFVLSRAGFTGAGSRREGVRLTNLISLTVACLKSLSPAGKTLTPMLAISVQGLLFSFGQWVGGVSILGHSIGISLISLWALSQGIILGWLLNGEAFLEAIRFGIEKIGVRNAGWVAGIGIALILGVGVFLVFVSRRMTQDAWKKYEERWMKVANKSERPKGSGFSIPWLSLFSVLITIGFLYWTQSPEARTIWIWLRPIGVLVALRVLISIVPPEKMVGLLRRRSPELSRNIESALNALRDGKNNKNQ